MRDYFLSKITTQAKLICKKTLVTNPKPLKTAFKVLKATPKSRYRGVYLIQETNKRFFNGEIFYVGKSTNLCNRIDNGHCSARDSIGNSSLRKKLKKYLPYKDMRKYLYEDCQFIIKEITNYDMATLVESMLIARLRKTCPLLNDSQ